MTDSRSDDQQDTCRFLCSDQTINWTGPGQLQFKYLYSIKAFLQAAICACLTVTAVQWSNRKDDTHIEQPAAPASHSLQQHIQTQAEQLTAATLQHQGCLEKLHFYSLTSNWYKQDGNQIEIIIIF